MSKPTPPSYRAIGRHARRHRRKPPPSRWACRTHGIRTGRHCPHCTPPTGGWTRVAVADHQEEVT